MIPHSRTEGHPYRTFIPTQYPESTFLPVFSCFYYDLVVYSHLATSCSSYVCHESANVSLDGKDARFRKGNPIDLENRKGFAPRDVCTVS